MKYLNRFEKIFALINSYDLKVWLYHLLDPLPHNKIGSCKKN